MACIFLKSDGYRYDEIQITKLKMFLNKRKYRIILMCVMLISAHLTAKPAGIGGFGSCRFDDLVIQGATNLNRFFLTYTEKALQPGQNLFINADNTDSSANVRFKIPVKSISGENKAMIMDLRDLFKARDYPNIIVGINKIKLHNLVDKPGTGKMILDITIAGVTKAVEAEYSTGNEKTGGLSLAGSTKLHLSDFDIIPPNKFFGLIKVKNEVIINFKIILSEV